MFGLYHVRGRLHVNHQLYRRAELAIGMLETRVNSEDANVGQAQTREQVSVEPLVLVRYRRYAYAHH
jgi:hypothetical protein